MKQAPPVIVIRAEMALRALLMSMIRQDFLATVHQALQDLAAKVSSLFHDNREFYDRIRGRSRPRSFGSEIKK